MNDGSLAPRTIQRAALAWLLALTACALYDAWLVGGGHLQVDTDIRAMLPRDSRRPEVTAATAALARSAQRRVILALAASDWPRTEAAAQRLDQVLATSADLKRNTAVPIDILVKTFAPHVAALLTPAERTLLATTAPGELADRALDELYSPLPQPRAVAWSADPLDLFRSWLMGQASQRGFTLRDGWPAIERAGRTWIVLSYESRGQAFAAGGASPLLHEVEAAGKAARSGDDTVEVAAGGLPLFAEAARQHAEHEINAIGTGSLVGMLLLTTFAFRAVRPRLMVLVSIAVGCVAALAVSVLCFGTIHVLTLVFGASLIGVAEDYGTNYFVGRLERDPRERWSVLARQAPVLWLALATTLIGYLGMIATPFPGLQEMAVFSLVGLIAAFVTVRLWFPFLDAGRIHETRFSRVLSQAWRRWPYWGGNRGLVVAVALALGLGGLATATVQIDDDVRGLQPHDVQRDADQARIARLLALPNPGQFFLVQGASSDDVLRGEELLSKRLATLPVPVQVEALSDWVPDAATQAANLAVWHRTMDGPTGVFTLLSERLHQPVHPQQSPTPLSLDQALAAGALGDAASLWLGCHPRCASVVLLRGQIDNALLTRLATVARGLPGVSWVDQVANATSILARYRHKMALILLLGFAGVAAVLVWRWGKVGWRALAPSAIASLAALAALGLLGERVTLFHVLALYIVLGVGVDYGIFLLGYPAAELGRAFLASTLGAAGTLLSFGLLAFSATPALHAFGITVLIGVALSWALAPLWCRGRRVSTDPP